MRSWCLTPSYPNSFLNARILGGVSGARFPLRGGADQLEIEEFEKTPDSKRLKMIVLTNPNNPTHYRYAQRESGEAGPIAVKNDLIVVCDQAFEDSVYDGGEFSPSRVPARHVGTHRHVCSISKGMALSGYRVAYIVADDHIMDVYYGSAVSVIGATNTASQLGAIAALKDASFLEEYNRIFDRRRKIVYEIFNSIPVCPWPCRRAPSCWVNVSRLGTADEVNAHIIKEANVVVNAGTPARRTKGGGRTPADCIRSLPGGRADGGGTGACQSRTHEAGKGRRGFLSNGRER